MFTNCFHMSDHPFPEPPGVSAIVHDARLRQGQARLEFLAHHASVALITGDEGVGKTVLARHFITTLQPRSIRTLYLHLNHLTTIGFLRRFAAALGEHPSQYKDQLLQQILDKIRASNMPLLVFIDDVQLLDAQALVDLRLLLDSPLTSAHPLKVVLLGHSQFKHEIKRALHLSLAQRINPYYHLPAFASEQTHAYIDFQMRRVGASDKLFEPEAKQAIHEQTRGVARLINNLATACLINAATHKRQKVDHDLVHQTRHEFPLYS
jgi:general secretion pathway protein A